MDKRIAMVGVLVLLLVGGVSGGLLDWFGRISGEVVVSGPVFYLDGEHEDGGVYHKLYVNELPDDEDIYFWDGHRLVFKTEDLGVEEFYDMELVGKVWMKTNNSGNTVQARFIQLDEDNQERTICEVSAPIVIGATSSFTKYEFSCESNGGVDFGVYDRIGVELRGNGDENQEYWVSVGQERSDGASRIEVMAI